MLSPKGKEGLNSFLNVAVELTAAAFVPFTKEFIEKKLLQSDIVSKCPWFSLILAVAFCVGCTLFIKEYVIQRSIILCLAAPSIRHYSKKEGLVAWRCIEFPSNSTPVSMGRLIYSLKDDSFYYRVANDFHPYDSEPFKLQSKGFFCKVKNENSLIERHYNFQYYLERGGAFEVIAEGRPTEHHENYTASCTEVHLVEVNKKLLNLLKAQGASESEVIRLVLEKFGNPFLPENQSSQCAVSK